MREGEGFDRWIPIRPIVAPSALASTVNDNTTLVLQDEFESRNAARTDERQDRDDEQTARRPEKAVSIRNGPPPHPASSRATPSLPSIPEALHSLIACLSAPPDSSPPRSRPAITLGDGQAGAQHQSAELRSLRRDAWRGY